MWIKIYHNIDWSVLNFWLDQIEKTNLQVSFLHRQIESYLHWGRDNQQISDDDENNENEKKR